MSWAQCTAVITILVLGAFLILILKKVSERIEEHPTETLAAESIAYGSVVVLGGVALINPALTALGVL